VVLAFVLAALAGTPVAVTLDDLPFVGDVRPGDTRTQAIDRIVAQLDERAIAATGFVVCKQIREGELAHWKGVELANHSTQHSSVDALGERAFVEDVRACGERLGRVRYFRYPYLQTGKSPALRDAVVRGLAEYTLAPVSIDTSDWALANAYPKADDASKGAIAEAYVDHVLAAARHYRSLARERMGRDVAHVLLLHANALAADHLGDVLDALRADDFSFVPLADALADPVYAMRDDYAGPIGMSWLYRTAPALPEAWAFDHGEQVAIETRFGGKQPKDPLAIGDDLTVRELAPDVVVVTDEKPFPANTLVAALADGSLLIAGSPYTTAATDALLTWARVRFGKRPITVIQGHFHGDGGTAGTTAYLRAGAAVYTSDRTTALLKERGAALHAGLSKAITDATVRAAVDATPWLPGNHTFPLSEGIALGEAQVIFPGAAHSPDNVVVYLPRLGVMFGGCMVRVDSLGNLSDADLASWPQAIARLRELHATIVVPGHGTQFDPGLLDRTDQLLRAAR
jgi:peptidoglycan/xylan/chitin deacetylase (PgdA/CDA1 family)